MQLIVKPETPSAALARVGQNIKIRTRYDNFIGGQWVAPTQGPVFREPHADQRRARLRDRPLDRRGHRARRSTPRTPPPMPGARRRLPARAAVLFKIADRMEANLPAMADGRDDRQRQADPRDDGRRPAARRRPLPLLRQLHPRAGRLAVGDRRDDDRLPLPRAARRRRPDHSVELPDPDGGVEARPGASPPATASC